jgi:hypothetical protein
MMNKAQLQDHLHTLEQRLFHPYHEADRQALLDLLADEYKEFCTSGRIYNRQQTVDVMISSEPRPATILHFNITQLAETVALATYRATTAIEVSHRSSLWIYRDNRWQLFFHQGTPAS